MIYLERASIHDAKSITQIKIKAYNKEINTYLGRNGGPPGYDQVESEQAIIQNLIAYKIIFHEKLIGAFFIVPVDEENIRFEDFVIHPDYQHKGFGRLTLQLMEKLYPKKIINLSTPIFSVTNQHLYESLGYVEISRNIDEIEYQKKCSISPH